MSVFFEYKGWHFEWDSEKEAKNIRVHGINFKHAAKFFRDGESVIYLDHKHSIVEPRWVNWGWIRVACWRSLLRGAKRRPARLAIASFPLTESARKKSQNIESVWGKDE
jgi:uncharacterized DUF497 family protein